MNVIETQHGVDASMSQGVNQDPSGQGEKIGIEKDRGNEDEIQEGQGGSMVEWNCELCKGVSTVCIVGGRRWCNRCGNQGIPQGQYVSKKEERGAADWE